MEQADLGPGLCRMSELLVDPHMPASESLLGTCTKSFRWGHRTLLDSQELTVEEEADKLLKEMEDAAVSRGAAWGALRRSTQRG